MARAEALLFPKLSFHFDGFFVTATGGGCPDTVVEVAGGGGRGMERSGVGIAYIEAGSKGFLERCDIDEEAFVEADR